MSRIAINRSLGLSCRSVFAGTTGPILVDGRSYDTTRRGWNEGESSCGFGEGGE